MKKCPFCAEEIQDSAIKCRYCGEWMQDKTRPVEESRDELNTKAGNVEIPTSEEGDELGIGKEAVPLPENSKKEGKRKTGIQQIILSEKPRWSWGWLVLLIFFSAGLFGVDLGPSSERTKALVTLVQLGGIAFLMFLYFKIRKRLIKKAYFKDIWVSSFIAGTISYLVSCLLTIIPIALITRIDQSAEIGQLRKTKYEIASKIIELNKEEIGLWGSVVIEPSTANDVENNKLVLSKLLVMLDNKVLAISRLVNNAKEIDSYSKNKQGYVGLYDKLKKKMDEYLNTYKKGVQLHIEYYEGFDEKKLNEGNDLIKKANLLAQDLLAEVAKIIEEWQQEMQ